MKGTRFTPIFVYVASQPGLCACTAR